MICWHYELWNTGLGTTLLYRIRFLRYFLYLSATHSHQPLLDGIICAFLPSPSYNRRLCHVLLFHLLTITASLHPSASGNKLTSSSVSLLAWVSSSMRYLSPLCMKGHYLLRRYQMATHGNVILAQQLEEVQNCLTGLTFSCASTNTPIPSSLQHTKKPLYVIILVSIPATFSIPSHSPHFSTLFFFS